MTLYSIHATVETVTPDGWTSTRHLPTFYLDPQVQGIVSENHAERIARRMLADVNRDATFHVSAYRQED